MITAYLLQEVWGGGTISAGTTIETAIRIRDFFKNRAYNFNDFFQAKKASKGVSLRLEEYARTHTKFNYSELREIYFSEPEKERIPVPIEEYEEFLQFKRFKKMEAQGGMK